MKLKRVTNFKHKLYLEPKQSRENKKLKRKRQIKQKYTRIKLTAKRKGTISWLAQESERDRSGRDRRSHRHRL